MKGGCTVSEIKATRFFQGPNIKISVAPLLSDAHDRVENNLLYGPFISCLLVDSKGNTQKK